MNTSVSKKRKSLSQKSTPAKSSKIEAQDDSETKNTSILNKSNGSTVKKTPKKAKTVEAASKDSPAKVAPFKGVKSLDGSPKEKSKRNRKPFVARLKERAEKDGVSTVVKSLNQKMDQLVSRPALTKTAKRKLKLYRNMIARVSGVESAAGSKPSPKKKAQATKKAGDKTKTAVAKKAGNKKGKKDDAVVEEKNNEEDEADQDSEGDSSDEDVSDEEGDVNESKQNALTLTGSQLDNRIIKVECTSPGKQNDAQKKKNQIKTKKLVGVAKKGANKKQAKGGAKKASP